MGERLAEHELGPLLARGRDAEVFALGTGRVLRRVPDPRDLVPEAELMEHVRAAGYPVPRVWRVGPGEMVLDRVEGPTMLEDLGRRPWRVDRHARTLAALHRRLGEVTAPGWLRPHPVAGDAVLHLDLHPGNVLLTSDGPVVIDWTNARRGAGPADAATTWLLLAAAEVDEGVGPLLRRALPAFRRRLITTFLAAVGREEARRALPGAAEHRLGDRNLRPAEREAIRALVARESG